MVEHTAIGVATLPTGKNKTYLSKNVRNLVMVNLRNCLMSLDHALNAHTQTEEFLTQLYDATEDVLGYTRRTNLELETTSCLITVEKMLADMRLLVLKLESLRTSV